MIFGSFPAFNPHWEVWGLTLAIIAGGIWVAKVIGPEFVGPDEKVISRRQATFFWLAVFTMTLVSVWPMHDIAESRLYSAHMLQHFVLTLVVPPLFLLSCPPWLADLFVEAGGRVWRVIRFLAMPVVAWMIFNGTNLISHWQPFVNLATTNGPFHFSVHVWFVITGLIMWTPVCGPWPQLRLSLPGQMVYLFLQSIIPTVPAAWLGFAHHTVYSSYDIPRPLRLWGISPISDQQVAGMIMKVGEAIYLWILIAIMFFRWAVRHHNADRQGMFLTERQILEWEEGERDGFKEPPVPSLPDSFPSEKSSG